MVIGGELVEHTVSNSTVDCSELHRGHMFKKIGQRIAVNFYNTLLVVLMLICGEFLQRILSNFDGRLR